MWKEFFRFELFHQLRQSTYWIIAGLFFILSFAVMSRDGIDNFPFMTDNIYRNSPIIVVLFMKMNWLFLFLIAPFFLAMPMLRDHDMRISSLIYAMPIRNSDYVWGRFLAGILLCSGLYWSISFGMMLGINMPWVTAERQGPWLFWPYLWNFLVLTIPNLFFLGALLSMLAITTRSRLAVYTGLIAIYALSRLTKNSLTPLSNEYQGWMLDFFGFQTISRAIQYYTTFEANHVLPSLSGYLLANRLLYITLALMLILMSVKYFKREHSGLNNSFFNKLWPKNLGTSSIRSQQSTTHRHHFIVPHFSFKVRYSQLCALYWWDLKWIVKSVPFLVLLTFTLVVFFITSATDSGMYGTPLMPTAATLLDGIHQVYKPLLLLIIVFYSGELVHRENQLGNADLMHVLPVSTSTFLLAKNCVLFSVVIVFFVCGVFAAHLRQLNDGVVLLESFALWRGAIIESIWFILMAWCALLVQVICHNKLLGFFVMLVIASLQVLLPQMEIGDHLLIFASLPNVTYSDMNEYGHYLYAWLRYAFYWVIFCLALSIIGFVFWTRGEALTWQLRYQRACKQLHGKSGRALSFFLLGFMTIGMWISYTGHSELSLDKVKFAQAQYELNLAKYRDVQQPIITHIVTHLDLFPEQRRLEVKGQYTIKNQGNEDMSILCLRSNVFTQTKWLNLPPHQVVLNDIPSGFRVIKLNKSLTPGNSIDIDFRVSVQDTGFHRTGIVDKINANGSMFNHLDYFPHFGYDPDIELSSPTDRKKFGLQNQKRMNASTEQNFFSIDTNWVRFDTTISTTHDQIAIAPGDLQETWEREGRRYFHYQVKSPMAPIYSYVSGRFQVQKMDWKGVSLEVYYDSKHTYNIERMFSTMRKSLDYYSSQFGSYPYKALRIVEFPRYTNLAQSFAAMIPFSESLGFTIDLRDRHYIDYVTYVTAHEIAHQWWGGQIIPADKNGARMILESLAQYSALMVMEKKYGVEKMRRFLRYELETYLYANSRSKTTESPLVSVADQRHTYYEKASLLLYRLRDEIGEPAMNRALRRFLDAKRYQDAPFATSQELLVYLRDETPMEKQALLTDLFEKNVFYDNSVKQAQAVQRSDGDWELKVDLSLAKFERSVQGEVLARNFDEPIEIAVFSRPSYSEERDEQVIFNQKFQLPSGGSTVKIHLKQKPYEVGVDAYNKWIDRVPNDNRKAVEFN